MLSALDQFYADQPEPTRGALLALRDIILDMDAHITAEWKYRMPFFYYKGKMFCYLWTDKQTKAPYIGIVEGKRIDHPLLEQGNRARMKILRINAHEDLPVEIITWILNEALALYRNGIGQTH